MRRPAAASRRGRATSSSVPNWVGAGQCQGTTLRGVQVFYVPAPGFAGTDRFALDVGYSEGRTVRAEVEVEVR